MGNENTDNVRQLRASPTRQLGTVADGAGSDYSGIEKRIEKLEYTVTDIDKRVVRIEERLNHIPTKLWIITAMITIVMTGGGVLIVIDRLLSIAPISLG